MMGHEKSLGFDISLILFGLRTRMGGQMEKAARGKSSRGAKRRQ
jgi:hypothetical protein